MTCPAWSGYPGGQENPPLNLLPRGNTLPRENLKPSLLPRENLKPGLLSKVNLEHSGKNKKVGVDEVKEEKMKRSKQFLKTFITRLKKRKEI